MSIYTQPRDCIKVEAGRLSIKDAYGEWMFVCKVDDKQAWAIQYQLDYVNEQEDHLDE